VERSRVRVASPHARTTLPPDSQQASSYATHGAPAQHLDPHGRGVGATYQVPHVETMQALLEVLEAAPWRPWRCSKMRGNSTKAPHASTREYIQKQNQGSRTMPEDITAMRFLTEMSSRPRPKPPRTSAGPSSTGSTRKLGYAYLAGHPQHNMQDLTRPC
jgi:hypothetical protein